MKIKIFFNDGTYKIIEKVEFIDYIECFKKITILRDNYSTLLCFGIDEIKGIKTYFKD